ncbi:MAG: hypothetical protein ACOY0T_26630 [Myxococcota bacterium]
MPKHHKKRSHKPHRKHASGHRHHHKHTVSKGASPHGHHHKRRRHAPGHGLPAQLREKLQQPVTVKTLRDIVALRRVQRGA